MENKFYDDYDYLEKYRDDHDDYDDYLEEGDVETERINYKAKAKDDLTLFFDESDKVFHKTEIEIKFEKEYFHWITAAAIKELIDEEILREKRMPLPRGAEVKFVFNKRLRYHKNKIKRKWKVIKEYSDPFMGRASGIHTELLFLIALITKGFTPKGRNTNEYEGKKWRRTKHNLDFIIQKDNIVYGCEVKNTFSYIDKKDLYTKLDICEHIGVKPLFIMRYAPKSYNYKINEREGFALIFKTKIFPYGQEKLVEKIRNIMDLPVDSPSAIPEWIIKRFTNWHKKQVDSKK